MHIENESERLLREAAHNIDALLVVIKGAVRRGQSPSDLFDAIASFDGRLDPLEVLLHIVRNTPTWDVWSVLEALEKHVQSPVSRTAIAYHRRKGGHARVASPRYMVHWRGSLEVRPCCDEVEKPLQVRGASEPNILKHWRSIRHCVHLYDVVEHEEEVREYARQLARILADWSQEQRDANA